MIYIDDRQNAVKAGEELEALIINTIEFALKEEGINEEIQVSVSLVDDREIADINKTYRHINRATDVLSFPMLEYPENKVFREAYFNFEFDESYMDGKELVLGDIVISLETAEKQAEEYGHSFNRELSYLTVHSVLHLLGYDHMQEKEKHRMRSREEEILNRLNMKRV